jgi:hypothetical protein
MPGALLLPSVARRTLRVPGAFGGFVIANGSNERAGHQIPARFAIAFSNPRSIRYADGAKPRLSDQACYRLSSHLKFIVTRPNVIAALGI